jgi:hypothetical protein
MTPCNLQFNPEGGSNTFRRMVGNHVQHQKPKDYRQYRGICKILCRKNYLLLRTKVKRCFGKLFRRLIEDKFVISLCTKPIWVSLLQKSGNSVLHFTISPHLAVNFNSEAKWHVLLSLLFSVLCIQNSFCVKCNEGVDNSYVEFCHVFIL